ncbi:hypothetical protein [Citrobacter portucalensis]|uniref:hypothetical protein n=1 Tax=Citrobacter portucalensis TaxID=1639133 RepID=UPI001951002D|nr:hypothetical protein [Citrobacter portucalensis]MBM6610763.1 hypothetical protein [Citrobacter portucalensis]
MPGITGKRSKPVMPDGAAAYRAYGKDTWLPDGAVAYPAYGKVTWLPDGAVAYPAYGERYVVAGWRCRLSGLPEMLRRPDKA